MLLATGILGATVMPHVIYLHSALTQAAVAPTATREEGRRAAVLPAPGCGPGDGRGGDREHVDAGRGRRRCSTRRAAPGSTPIEGAHSRFRDLVGGGAALAFAVALLASGFASASVGTYAGQVVMQGFIGRTIPLALRRLVTMVPALCVLAVGIDPTEALVISQVVLSFGIPFALVPLILFSRDRALMGEMVNRRLTTVAASVVAAGIIALNVFLLFQTFSG